MTATDLSIDARYCGPQSSGNGGVSAGLLAELIGCGPGDAAEVRLHAMPPLDRPLRSSVLDGTVRLTDGDTLVLSGRRVEWPDAATRGTTRSPATWEEALAASESTDAGPYSPERHPYPTCFVCGPARTARDGLRIFAHAVPDRGTADDLVFASPWIPDDTLADPAAADPAVVRGEIVWGSLDCPGGQALHVAGTDHDSDDFAVLLGTFTARVLAPVIIDERYVLTAWQRAPHDGRKRFSTCVLTQAETGDVIGESLAIWITVPRV